MRGAQWFLGAGLVPFVLTLVACGGDDGIATSSASVEAAASSALVAPDAFAARMGEPGVVTINVHTPDEGSIAGTDLAIAFDQIATSSDLPVDRSIPLAIYCRSGNMSADAVEDLETIGYTDIVELEGGFNAWEASGRPLEPTVG